MKGASLKTSKWFFLPFLFLSVVSILYSQDNLISDDIVLLSPATNKTVISKRPFIKCKINKKFSKDNISVMLDDTDITQMLTFNKDGFNYKSFMLLSSGEHTLSIVISSKNGDIQKDFNFTTKQSKYFDTAENKLTISPLFEATIKKPKADNETPYSKLEGGIVLDTELKKGDVSYSFNTSMRYLDQNSPATENKKGFDLAGYLYSANYQDEKLQSTLQIGDISMDVSENTLSGFGNRGGLFTISYDKYTLNVFSTNAQEFVGFRGGLGIDNANNNHINGVTLEKILLNDKIKMKGIYIKGNMLSDGNGGYSTSGAQDSEVVGLLLNYNILDEKLLFEGEIDFSKMDVDTSDKFGAINDKAYRANFSGQLNDVYGYSVGYHYFGPDYGLVAGPDSKNLEGYSANFSANYEKQSFDFTFSKENDNVKIDPLYPVVYTTVGTLEYSYNGFENFPIGASIERTHVKSTKDLYSSDKIDKNSDKLSFNIAYQKEKWTHQFTYTYSKEDDLTLSNADSIINEYSFSPAFEGENISIAPVMAYNISDDKSTSISTDTKTLGLDISGNFMDQKIEYSLSSSYEQVKSSDGSTKENTLSSEFRVAYNLQTSYKWMSNPNFGLRGNYNLSDDKVANQKNEDFTLIFFVSLPIEYLF